MIKMVRMGPMIQQIQQPCQVAGCHKGTVCSRKNVKEVLEVHIPRGASNGAQRINCCAGVLCGV
eukprot:COSAG01_NODE_309_length_19142_cov_22.748149_9_plen_64_part_00